MTQPVKQEFDGDSSRLEAAYEKLQRAQVKLKEQLDKVAEANGRARQQNASFQKQFEQHSRQQVSALVGMARNWLSVGAGIALVTSALSEQKQKLQEVAKEADDTQAKVLQAISLSGFIQGGEELIAGVAQRQGVGTGRALAAFQGVVGAGPLLDRARQEQLTEVVAGVGRAGLDEQLTGQVVARLANVLKDKSAGDLLDIATFSQQGAGDASRLLANPQYQAALANLTRIGLSPEKTLATLTAAQGAAFEVTQLTSLTNALEQRTKKIEGGNLTADERAINQFVEAPVEEALKLLIENAAVRRKVLVGEAAGKVANLDFGQIEQLAKGFADAQSGDAYATLLGQAQQTKAGRGVAAKIAAEAGASGVLRGPGAVDALAVQRFAELVDSASKAEGGWQGWYSRRQFGYFNTAGPGGVDRSVEEDQYKRFVSSFESGVAREEAKQILVELQAMRRLAEQQAAGAARPAPADENVNVE